MQYTDDQKAAVAHLNEFLHGPHAEFCLSGRAGVGKTTVIKDIARKRPVLGLTISHKAKNVLSSSIPGSKTIAAGLGMKMRNNNLGEITFIVDPHSDGLPPISTAMTVVVDECSMISAYVQHHIRKLKRTGCKIIYMGDRHQLPPIDKDRKPGEDSPTFDVDRGYEIRQRVRQDEGSPITQLSDVIAAEIRGKHSMEFLRSIRTNYDKENGTGYATASKVRCIERMVVDWMDGNDSRVIAYRNKTVARYNEQIRTMIYGENCDRFMKNEAIVGNNPYKVEDETILENGEDAEVRNITVVEHEGVQCYSLDIGKHKPLMVVHPSGEEAYKKELGALLADAQENKQLWYRYFGYKELFADVSYAYAINTHKSQGSTYDNVFCDVGDITSVARICQKERLQSLYVAATRPAKNLALMV